MKRKVWQSSRSTLCMSYWPLQNTPTPSRTLTLTLLWKAHLHGGHRMMRGRNTCLISCDVRLLLYLLPSILNNALASTPVQPKKETTIITTFTSRLSPTDNSTRLWKDCYHYPSSYAFSATVSTQVSTTFNCKHKPMVKVFVLSLRERWGHGGLLFHSANFVWYVD